MSRLTTVQGYRPILGGYETQRAIGILKRTFEDLLANALNLNRVSAPLFVDGKTGLNDDLNGIERPVSFDIKETGTEAQIVHSLAKWKRYALYAYGFPVGKGLYTDMNAVRRDEEMDNLHSIYVDQWDWEKVISEEDRNEAYLRETVRRIVEAISQTEDRIRLEFSALTQDRLNRDVVFITTQQLADRYPSLSSKERENAFLKEHRTAFIMQIGGRLRSGERHDGRAPDYDDWQLNGDILYWNDLLGCAFEISSMGIRVDREALDRQLTEASADDRRTRMFHRLLLDGTLPLTMGGGIGQSRLCMLMLGKAHIGEVQASVWDSATVEGCARAGIPLL